METAAPPAPAADMGVSPTMSVVTVKAITDDAPAEQPEQQETEAAGVESTPPEADALEGREQSTLSVSSEKRDESPVEEARDEPVAEPEAEPEAEPAAEVVESVAKK